MPPLFLEPLETILNESIIIIKSINIKKSLDYDNIITISTKVHKCMTLLRKYIDEKFTNIKIDYSFIETNKNMLDSDKTTVLDINTSFINVLTELLTKLKVYVSTNSNPTEENLKVIYKNYMSLYYKLEECKEYISKSIPIDIINKLIDITKHNIKYLDEIIIPASHGGSIKKSKRSKKSKSKRRKSKSKRASSNKK